jgi:hypothetical protein
VAYYRKSETDNPDETEKMEVEPENGRGEKRPPAGGLDKFEGMG